MDNTQNQAGVSHTSNSPKFISQGPSTAIPGVDAGDKLKATANESLPDSQSLQTVKLDELGPMVVNSDGTLSRIGNWTSMTESERERTIRIISARNRLRIVNEEKKQQERAQETGSASTSEQPVLSILGTNASQGAGSS